MSYIEMIKKLNTSLPDTSVVDYRDISYDELWNRVYNFLLTNNLVNILAEDTIKKIKVVVFETNFVDLNKDKKIGQNDYVVKNMLIFLRIMIIKYICLDLNVNCSCDEFYWNGFGNIEEIVEFISMNSIFNNVYQLIDFTSSDDNIYGFSPDLIINYLFLYYGICDIDNNILSEHVERYEKVRRTMMEFQYADSSIRDLRKRKRTHASLKKVNDEYTEIKKNCAKNVAINIQFMVIYKLSNRMQELRKYRDVLKFREEKQETVNSKTTILGRVRRRKKK